MPYDVSDDVMMSEFLTINISKINRDTGVISIDDVQEIVYAESNGHVTEDVTRPYDIIVVT